MSIPRYSSIENRVARFKTFYTKTNDRPLLGFFTGSEYPLHRYGASRNLPEGTALTPDDFPTAPYLDDSEQLFQSHEACGGDLIWSGCAFWGIPWLEAMLGCTIIADQASGSIHSEPPVSFDGAGSLPDFDPSSPWALKTAEYLDALAERSGGTWPLATTRLRGVSDLLSALYGGEKFIYAMMEDPAGVHAAAEKCAAMFIDYARFQLERIPKFHGGIGSFYYYLWAPEGTVWHQEDAAALLSPDLYGEFIEPYDRMITEALPGCIMHQHTTGYLPTERYLDMEFTALEMHIDTGGPSAEALYDKHRAILDSKPLIIWGHIPEKDMDWIREKLPHEGLCVITTVENPEEAETIWRRWFG